MQYNCFDTYSLWLLPGPFNIIVLIFFLQFFFFFLGYLHGSSLLILVEHIIVWLRQFQNCLPGWSLLPLMRHDCFDCCSSEVNCLVPFWFHWWNIIVVINVVPQLPARFIIVDIDETWLCWFLQFWNYLFGPIMVDLVGTQLFWFMYFSVLPVR